MDKNQETKISKEETSEDLKEKIGSEFNSDMDTLNNSSVQ